MLGASLQNNKKPPVAAVSAELGGAPGTTDGKTYRKDDKKSVCANCKQIFTPKRSSRRFCSDSCRKRLWDKRAVIKALRAQFNAFMDDLEAGL
jgi:protein-arginine kinase activator protein McsA